MVPEDLLFEFFEKLLCPPMAVVRNQGNQKESDCASHNQQWKYAVDYGVRTLKITRLFCLVAEVYILVFVLLDKQLVDEVCQPV